MASQYWPMVYRKYGVYVGRVDPGPEVERAKYRVTLIVVAEPMTDALRRQIDEALVISDVRTIATAVNQGQHRICHIQVPTPAHSPNAACFELATSVTDVLRAAEPPPNLSRPPGPLTRKHAWIAAYLGEPLSSLQVLLHVESFPQPN